MKKKTLQLLKVFILGLAKFIRTYYASIHIFVTWNKASVYWVVYISFIIHNIKSCSLNKRSKLKTFVTFSANTSKNCSKPQYNAKNVASLLLYNWINFVLPKFIFLVSQKYSHFQEIIERRRLELISYNVMNTIEKPLFVNGT